MIQDHAEKGHISSDLSSLMKQYIDIAENLQSHEEDDGGDGDNNDGGNGQNSGGSAFSGGSSNNDENKSQPQPSSSSFSGFSFASSSAPPPSSGGTTFSFTGGSAPAPAAATVSKSKPTFSFGAQPAAASGGSNNTTNEDDPTSNPDDGKLDIGQEENEDEETLYEVRARLLRMDGEWRKLGTGALRLYRNKTTDKSRMVQRNDMGKVMFNVAVSKGMIFNKVSHRTQKGKVLWYVHFVAVEDANEEPKQIKLNISKESIDGFHKELEKLAA